VTWGAGRGKGGGSIPASERECDPAFRGSWFHNRRHASNVDPLPEPPRALEGEAPSEPPLHAAETRALLSAGLGWGGWVGVYPDRIAGGDRDHRDSGEHAAPGAGEGEGAGTNSPARTTDRVGPLTADHTLVFPARKTWTSNHGTKGAPPLLGETDWSNTPAGVNQSFSDGHAEWVPQARFERAGPNLGYPKPLWSSGWPWDWAWVDR
jgi:hypothetical protein